MWLTEDGVEVSGVAPETAVIDLAMKTSESGMKIDFYYRNSIAGEEAADISTIDSSWTLFNPWLNTTQTIRKDQSCSK